MAVGRERRHHLQSLTLPPPPQPPSTFVLPPPSVAAPFAVGDLQKLSVLGRGGGGTVYKVRHGPTATILALKVLNLSSSSSAASALVEADVLRRLDSPFTVRCHAVIPDGDNLCFAMDCVPNGSLKDAINERRGRGFDEGGIARVAERVLRGLRYLHGLGIVHGDINPSNLLVDEGGEIKIADFGASRVVADGAEGNTNIESAERGGTCAYMSPERFDCEGFGGGGDGGGFAGDVWGLGVVVLECYLGRFPLVGAGERADWATLMCMVRFGGMPEVPVKASPEFRGFVERCLEKEWRRRGTVGELLEHPFLEMCSSSCPVMEGFAGDGG